MSTSSTLCKKVRPLGGDAAENGGQIVNNFPGRLARADRLPHADRQPVKLTRADGQIHKHRADRRHAAVSGHPGALGAKVPLGSATNNLRPQSGCKPSGSHARRQHSDRSCSHATRGPGDEPSAPAGRCRGGHSLCPSPPPPEDGVRRILSVPSCCVHGVETQPQHAPAWAARAATICGIPTAPAAHSDDDFSWLVGEFFLTHLDAGTAYEPAYTDSKAGSEEVRDEPAMIIEHLEEELINDTLRLDWWLSQPEWIMLWMLSKHPTCHDAAVWHRARAWEHAHAQTAWAQQEARRFCSPSVSSHRNVRFAPY